MSRPLSTSLRIEPLEDRRMLATYVVNNLSDLVNNQVVVGSLRQAIQLSNASPNEDDTIVFANYLFSDPATGASFPGTISLNGGQLAITDQVRIFGPGAGVLTISGDPGSRVFDINIDADNQFRAVTIGGVTITGGSLNENGRGGAIQTSESLVLNEVVIEGNFAAEGGGAIYQPHGNLTVQYSLIQGNSSGGGGGGIYNGSEDGDLGSTVTVFNSTITGNNTFGIVDHPGFGGGLFTRRGLTNIQNSTISENTASFNGGGVATYGVDPMDADPPTITTTFTHTIAYGNTTAGDDNDVAAIFRNIDDELIRPDLQIIDFNIIGVISDFSQAGAGGSAYVVVSVPDGITWDEANAVASSPFFHLATITSDAENQAIFSLIDNPLYWVTFEPEDPMTDMRPPQTTGPWIGGIQTDLTNEAAGGWEWVPPDQQVPFDNFLAWDVLQPDNGAITDIDDPPQEDRLAFHTTAPDTRAATWGDYENDPAEEFKPIAFVIEIDQGTNLFGVDPLLMPLDYYAGSTNVYYLDPLSPALDAGNPLLSEDPTYTSLKDQRGRHFDRIADGDFDGIAIIDIGAVEVQRGNFVVDALEDESDGQYSGVWDTVPVDSPVLPNGTNVNVYGDYEQPGDFSLREALLFSQFNPEVDTIRFSSLLNNNSLNADPTPSAAATILLRPFLGQITVDHEVNILGPQFILEIDATGNDPTPATNNGDGTRVIQFTADAIVTMTNLTIMGGDRQELGGGILTTGEVTLRNVTVKENSSTGFGGAIAVLGGVLAIETTTINNNRSSSTGGGLYNNGGDVTISNSTISGNTGTLHGGGVANANGNLVIEYSTITLNTAGSTLGSGLASFRNGTATTQVRSSIIAGNTTNDVQHVMTGANNITSLGYNLIGNGNAVTAGVFSAATNDLTNTNPMLAPLVKLGGLTAVHRLLPGSPAIDMGDPTATAGTGNVPLYDQRGFPFHRVIDGNNDSVDRIDIGAFEVQTGILYVGDGSAAEGSYSTFIAALADANASPLPETIVFLFTWVGETFPTGSIAITDSVDIIGLGSTAMFFRGLPDLTVSVDNGNDSSLLDVSISGIRFESNTHIVSKENLTLDDMLFVDNGSTTTSLDGRAITQQFGDLKINNSTFIGNSSAAIGGGGAIHVLDGDLEIKNTLLSGNSTAVTGGKGGAIYIRNGNLNAEYMYLTANVSSPGTGDGGALYGRNSTMTLTNSIISGNRSDGSNAEGGGVHLKDSQATLINTIVAFNRTTGLNAKGGGIFLDGGSLTIEGGELFQNFTTGANAHGGAIASVNGDVVIDGLNVSENSTAGSDAHGGAFYVQDGNLTVVDSAVYNNKTAGIRADGGAIYSNTNLTGKKTTILNSTISGNASEDKGGGIYNADGLTVITHSTITNNSVPYYGFGGGVATFGNSATTRTDVGSSIIAGNKVSVNLPGNTSTDVDRVGGSFNDTFNSLGYNLIGTGLTTKFAGATNDLFGVTDPGLGALGSNGGVTLTHALLEDSLAVNRGNPSAVAGVNGVPEFDQRGEARIQQGRIDIGAFESNFSNALPGDFNDDGVVNGRDFLAWQRNPSVGSLADWQANYGTSGALVASVVTTEDLIEPSLAPVVAEDETESAPQAATENTVVQLGWILPFSAATERTPVPAEETNFEAAYLAAFEADLAELSLSHDDLDFGDIATNRAVDAGEESEDLAAEDTVFELLGASQL